MKKVIEVFKDYLVEDADEEGSVYYIKGYEKYGKIIMYKCDTFYIGTEFGYLEYWDLERDKDEKEFYHFRAYDNLREACDKLYNMFTEAGVKLFSKAIMNYRIKQVKLNGKLERMGEDFV